MANVTDIDVDKQLGRLQQEIASIRNDMGSLLTAIKEVSLEKGENVYHKAREAGEVIRGQAVEAQREVGHYIEERPLSSVMVAFGTGFLLGSLINLRR
jgi:ElaB/YqjD/DUF883 family membrane-anchored ribosome-binding protein